MEKRELKKLLRNHRKELEKFGVKRIGIFGSFARNEATDKSDIDLVVEFEKDRGGMKDFVELIDFLEKLLGKSVDLLTPGGIEAIRIKYIRERIKREIEYV